MYAKKPATNEVAASSAKAMKLSWTKTKTDSLSMTRRNLRAMAIATT
jgi:hypothetical protein